MRYRSLVLGVLAASLSGCAPIIAGVLVAGVGQGGGGGGGGASGSTSPPPGSPAAPRALSASRSGAQVSLNWTDRASNESAYRVERRDPGGVFATVATLPSNSTTHAEDLGTAEGDHEYRVRATNDVGDSAPSNTARVDLPPRAPTALGAVATGTRVDLAWTDASTIESGYRVERKDRTASVFATLASLPAGSTAYADLTGTQDGRYDYRVVATGSSVDSSPSAVASANLRPAAPSNLTANRSGAQVSLGWTDGASAETGFRVERRALGGGFAAVATLSANATTYVESIGSREGAYDYRVVATNGAGESAPSNTATATLPPRAPTALGAVASGTRVDLAWTDNSAIETGYRVERKDRSASAFAALVNLPAGSTAHADLTGTQDGRYDYRVVATSAATDSSPSNTASANLVPAPPSNLVATALPPRTVSLTWTDGSAAETAFSVQRRTGTDPFVEVATTGPNVTTYSDAVPPNDTYEYLVRARNAAGDSGPSNVDSASLPPVPPEVRSVAPRFGPESGGTVVTIIGLGFQQAGIGTTVVRFGSVLAASVVVVNDTTITCVTPAANVVDLPFVDVTVSNGVGSPSLAEAFTYTTALTVEPFSGSSVPAFLEEPGVFTVSNGSCRITANQGRNYARTLLSDYGTKDLVFELSLLSSFGSTNDMIAFAGLGAGQEDTANDGEPLQSLSFRFHAPQVQSGRVDGALFGVTPALGRAGLTFAAAGVHRLRVEKIGRRAVLFVQRNWTGGPFVGEGSFLVEDLDTAPFLATNGHLFFGSGSVFGTAGAQSMAFDDLVIAELRAPPVRCRSVSPSSGSSTGGTAVTLSGAGFLGAAPSVFFGAAQATDVVVVDDATITCTTPATASALHDVKVVGTTGTALCRQGYRSISAFFDSDFSGTTLHPNLEDVNAAFAVNGVIRRIGQGNSRHYVRTRLPDYATRDFLYEITVNTGGGTGVDIMFVGLGTGANGASGEPDDSINFRIHPPDVVGGRVDVAFSGGTGGGTIGSLPGGTHRCRIERRADTLELSIDASWTGGPFVADLQYTTTTLAADAPFLATGPSHLFFGHTFQNQSFDDLSVGP